MEGGSSNLSKVNTGLTSINAGVIIWLFSTFVPQKEYDKLYLEYRASQTELVKATEKINMLWNIESSKFQ